MSRLATHDHTNMVQGFHFFLTTIYTTTRHFKFLSAGSLLPPHPITHHHPRFIVFPAPLGCASVYCAHRSSLSLFSSAFTSPNAVPSISASSASCSDVVGSFSDRGLPFACCCFDVVVCVYVCVFGQYSCECGHMGERERERSWDKAYPPPVMMFPLCCSISRYSSIVMDGSRWSGWKT